ncbi:MAG: DUF3667 domain-containing protein [Flavobacteriales bacterium]|nr:DUF3667 domain-containing protein [Flavobacteriales bacterium]
MSEAIPCKSCGNAVSGLYCSACGEKVLTPDDHTLKHYLGALLNAFTFADSKFWNTLKAVVLRPGELSAAYMDGRRVKYMRPVAFFFLANFIYFAVPLFETFNTTLNSQLHNQQYSGWAQRKVEAHLAESGRTLEEFKVLYEPASANNAKLLLVTMVFLLLQPMSVLYIRKRRFVSAYITASFELMGFYLWVATLALGAISFILLSAQQAMGAAVSDRSVDELLAIPLVILHFWFTIGIGRRFFVCTWLGATWRAAAMLFGLQFALSAYRLLLFQATMWSINA